VIVLALVSVTALGVLTFVYDRLLTSERARVNDLLRLLESKAAPAETVAYLSPTPPTQEPAERYLCSDDGLIGVRTEPEPD
jgi:hypothetical protein